MIHKLNPVVIAGFDILYLGRKGFAPLGEATRALLRPKSAPKDAPWVEISLKRQKTKRAKEAALLKALTKLSKQSDVEAEEAIRKAKKKASSVPEKQIKFEHIDTVDKSVRSLDGYHREVRKFYFSADKSYEFVRARDINMFDVERYLKSVKKTFLDEVFSIHGTAPYLLRMYHEYQGLPSLPQIDPLDKGFSGFGLNRQTMTREDVDEQFMIMSELYLERFTKYLAFARTDTLFRFTGFTAEVTLDVLTPEEDIGRETVRQQKKKYRRKPRKKPVKKETKKPAKKKAVKKATKKKPKKSPARKPKKRKAKKSSRRR